MIKCQAGSQVENAEPTGLVVLLDWAFTAVVKCMLSRFGNYLGDVWKELGRRSIILIRAM
jgi:hypothetical protein